MNAKANELGCPHCGPEAFATVRNYVGECKLGSGNGTEMLFFLLAKFSLTSC